MTRTVADAAALLSAMAGSDAQDSATALADQQKTDYTQALKRDGLKGKRLGVVRGQWTASSDLVATVLESQLAVLKAQGAVLVEVPMVPNTAKYGDSELTVLLYELKADLNAYLAEYAPTA